MQNGMQNVNTNHLSGIILQKLRSTAPTMSNLTPEKVDAVIDCEMKSVMAKYAAEEESFVDQKLIENPVVCERRSSTRFSSDSSSSNRDPLQQQRAESCRKSRINNKIRKAKTKLRHKFITMKLAQNAATLESIRDVIANAEAKLRNSGCSEATLENLRKTMGIDRMEIDNLAEIRKQLANVVDSN